MSVTLTEMPEPMTWVMAGRPSTVAGILMSTLGRSTAAARVRASSMVPAVSCASRGSTSIDTLPSRPPVASYTGRKTSQASLTSCVVSAKTASSTLLPESASSRTWVSYACPSDSAAWKIDGFVVTPTTPLPSMSFCRLPEVRRSRERSSSQMETPFAARSWTAVLVMVLSLPCRGRALAARRVLDADVGAGVLAGPRRGVGHGRDPATVAGGGQGVLGRPDHGLGREPELAEQGLGVG